MNENEVDTEAENLSKLESDYSAIWADDLIGDRRSHAEFLGAYLSSKGDPKSHNRGFVLNIDAEWGAGKSFFMRRLRSHLEAKHLVAFVDAWKDDFADDPLIPVLQAVQSAFNNQDETLAKKSKDLLDKGLRIVGMLGAGLIKRQAYRVFGDAVEEIMGGGDPSISHPQASKKKTSQSDQDSGVSNDAAAAMEEAFTRVGDLGGIEASAFDHARQLVDEFLASLRALATAVDESKEVDAPIFIMIDELDRCRPTYAIELLERVKHIFEAPGVVFIIATDTEQLAHSVKAVYGEGFDGRRYLQRFFDQSYLLPSPTGDGLIAAEFHAHEIDESLFHRPYGLSLHDQISDVVAGFHLKPREVKRLFTTFAAAAEASKLPVPIIAPYLAALVVAQVRSDKDLWDALTNRWVGNDASKAFSQYVAAADLVFPPRHVGTTPNNSDNQISMANIIEAVLRVRNEPTSKDYSRDQHIGPRFGQDGWAKAMLIAEFEATAPHNFASEQKSVLRNYPNLVTSAGRIQEVAE